MLVSWAVYIEFYFELFYPTDSVRILDAEVLLKNCNIKNTTIVKKQDMSILTDLNFPLAEKLRYSLSNASLPF